MTTTTVRVPYVNLPLQIESLKNELLGAVASVLERGDFILGEQVEIFEQRFAQRCGTRYAVGVANGTEALSLALRAVGVGPGDEVITAPNSFLASASCIALVGARPVFADVREDYNIDPARIEAAITPKTKAILPVHLTGRPAEMDVILGIARRHGLHVIEDAAQAIGASFRGISVGNFGVLGCFSLHPLKNLAAPGDGGIITTNDDAFHRYLVKARNHGLKSRDECEFWSPNSRLDTVHAAMLNVKLEHLDRWSETRRAIADRYRDGLDNMVVVPKAAPHEVCVYQTFVIQADRRDELQRFLLERGVETKVHYPVPIHLQEAAQDLGYKKGDFPVTESLAERILSLPIYPEIRDDQIEMVIAEIRAFYRSGR